MRSPSAPIDELMLLHPALAAERGADYHGFEVMAVAGDLDVIAGQPFLDIALDVCGMTSTSGWKREGHFSRAQDRAGCSIGPSAASIQ